AFVLAFGLEVEHASLDHQRARGVPEVEREYLALTRQEVVFDGEPLHGLEVATEDGGGDEVGDLAYFVGGGFVAAVFERVERVEADLFAAGEFFHRRRRGIVRANACVPLADAGVEVPAVEVDALAPGG